MKRKVSIVIISIMLMLIALTTKVEANYQSRPGVETKVNVTQINFFNGIRAMENAGEVMGLNGQADNGIDVHMVKVTEWGTAAMLAASSYGKVGNVGAGDSTTGNNYGVFDMAGSIVTATADGVHVEALNNMYWTIPYGTFNPTYTVPYRNTWEKYGTGSMGGANAAVTNTFMPGSAIGECEDWQGAIMKSPPMRTYQATNYIMVRGGRTIFELGFSFEATTNIRFKSMCGSC